MTYKMVIFANRKPGVSLEEYKDHYENIHVPLVKSLAGDEAFPLSHQRSYIGRAPLPEGAEAGSVGTPLAVMGDASDFTWDSMSILTFKDEEHFNKAMGVLTDPEKRAKISADEETFVDQSSLKAVILGEVNETKNESMT